MPFYEVTFTRTNSTKDGSAPESSYGTQTLARDADAAIQKAKVFWNDQEINLDDFTAAAVNLED